MKCIIEYMTENNKDTKPKTLAERINSETLTLEQKLKLIDEATRNNRAKSSAKTRLFDHNAAPTNPGDLLICDGCE